ncbi:MAG: sortase [Chloroflexota bacterium]|nr:sortase [Chloroflexota bacterium]
MTLRGWKIANIFIWSGIGLLLLGMGLNYSLFRPYFDTLFKTQQLAAAPPFDETLGQVNAGQDALKPFDKHDAGTSTVTNLPPTVTASPTSCPPTATSTPWPPTATSTPLPPTATVPTPIPTPTGTSPQYIRIPTIGLAATIVPVPEEKLADNDTGQLTWAVPDWEAVGWHSGSALLGEPGNTVLNGHNTTRGEIFRDLYQVEEGARILLTGADQKIYFYRVAHVYILEERGQPLEVRRQNAQYIQATTDERVTLVTCHPYASTRYRLIVIAKPI